MTTCCGVTLTVGTHCAFCRRTIRLIREGRCVACAAIVHPGDTDRSEGRCGDCRKRGVIVNRSTARLLKLAAKARYRAAA